MLCMQVCPVMDWRPVQGVFTILALFKSLRAKTEHLVQSLCSGSREVRKEREREKERRLSHPAIVQLPPGLRTRASSGHGAMQRVTLIKTLAQLLQMFSISFLWILGTKSFTFYLSLVSCSFIGL